MVDLSQFATVAGLATLIVVIVQVFKGTMKTEAVPYFAIVVGILMSVGLAYVQGQLTSTAVLMSNVLGGFLAALIAVGGYEATIDKFRS